MYAAAETQGATQLLGEAPARLPLLKHEDAVAAAQPSRTGSADRAPAQATQSSETEGTESRGDAGSQPGSAALPKAGEGPQEQLWLQQAACSQEQAPSAG